MSNGPSGSQAVGPSGRQAVGPSGSQAVGPSGRQAVALALCVVLTAAGCRHVETIAHGQQYTADGSLQVASLQPSCACVSLRNKTSKKIALQSSYVGVMRGQVFLDPGEKLRAMFDWAGEDNQDFYSLDAFDVGADGKATTRLRMQDVTDEYAPYAGMSCGDSSCMFNGLAMNRMMDDVEELERETATRGINFTSVIEASAPLNQCGCMMLTNFSAHDLTLRATLHGTETGQIELMAGKTLPVPFDWAGAIDTDVYVVEAVDVRTPNDARPGGVNTLNAPSTTESPATRAGSAMTIRLKDHVEIAGTLVNMSCQPDYAEFQKTGANGDLAVRCPWNPAGQRGLGMRVAYDKKMKLESTNGSAPAAPPARPQP